MPVSRSSHPEAAKIAKETSLAVAVFATFAILL
jgi:hypothetical protein